MRKEVEQMPDGRIIIYYWFREHCESSDSRDGSAPKREIGEEDRASDA